MGLVGGLVGKVTKGAKDFRNGLSIIFGKPKLGEGDRKLARMAIMVEAQIDTYGKNAVRTQLIKSIESDMKRAARKGKEAVDDLMNNAFATPEYMRLLQKLGLNDTHVRVMAIEAIRKASSTKTPGTKVSGTVKVAKVGDSLRRKNGSK